jgi:hypothetical protein
VNSYSNVLKKRGGTKTKEEIQRRGRMRKIEIKDGGVRGGGVRIFDGAVGKG